MEVSEYSLFPTRVVSLQFAEVGDLNGELCQLFDESGEFAGGFDMHPDAMNLLSLAERIPGIARLRGMFLDGLKCWLGDARGARPDEVDLVMFSNFAAKGELTLVHNHNADLVGVYYARTAPHDRPAVHEPTESDEYFDVGNGHLVLHDPRFNANLAAVGQRDYVNVYPRPGLMLIFPAYLWHSVTPHQSEFHRLSFSMNFTLRWPGRSAADRRRL